MKAISKMQVVVGVVPANHSFQADNQKITMACAKNIHDHL
jgi:IMP cyclohydrolase